MKLSRGVKMGRRCSQGTGMISAILVPYLPPERENNKKYEWKGKYKLDSIPRNSGMSVVR